MSDTSAFWLANPSTGFYPETVNQSLRFNEGDTSYLERTFVTPSSTRKVIIATWIKPSELGDETPIMYSAPTSATTSYFLMGFAQDGYISAEDSFKIFTVEGNSAKIALRTTALFRDPTNWMHVCVAIDTDQGTSTDRVMIFFNGKRYTGSYNSYNTFPSENHDFTVMNSAIKHRIGSTSNGLHANYGNLAGYLSEFYFIDGQSMFSDNSATVNSTFLNSDADTLQVFCEQKNGVAVPKAYSGTFGNNGCRLTFEAAGTGTTAESTNNAANMTNIGDDKSGQGHNFSVNGLVGTDVVLDSPTNNFATLNPLDKSGGTFSEGNLRYDTSTWDMATGTFLLPSGKWYYEVRVDESVSGKAFSVGIIETNKRRLSGNSYYWSAAGWNTSDQGYLYGVNVNGTTEYKISAGSAVSLTSHPDIVQNSVIGIFIDLESSTTSIKYNVDGGTPFELFTGMQDTDYIIGTSNYQTQLTFNFGQDSTFAGQETAGGNTDANGKGDFHSALPASHTDYLALCSSNLPELTISPAQDTKAGDHFNTVLYNANNQTAQSITGVGFKPDWLWFKQRARSDAHSWYDSNRGIGPILRLTSHTEYSNTNLVTSFDVDGFSLGTDPFAWVNYQSDSMVAWCWKGNGGTPVSNSEGSLTCNVQANTTSGFSIITWTGDGNSSVTLGHGLEKKPELIIYKGRENSFSWPTWFKTFGTTTGSFIDTSNQPGTFARVKSEPTTTVIPNAELNYTNTNGEGSIAYVFHSVEGYSKIGSYVGNGSSDGVFVYLGFRPAWIITKKVSGSGNWYINDSARSPFNSTDLFGKNLYADSQGDESGNGMDMLSNGFKIRNTDSSQNTSSGTYLYMAFAEQPFKFSNAR